MTQAEYNFANFCFPDHLWPVHRQPDPLHVRLGGQRDHELLLLAALNVLRGLSL